MVTFRLFGAEKSVLKLVGANLKDGQIVLLAGRLFGFVARESHYFSWSCLPRSCQYCIAPCVDSVCLASGYGVPLPAAPVVREDPVRSCGWLLNNVARNFPVNL